MSLPTKPQDGSVLQQNSPRYPAVAARQPFPAVFGNLTDEDVRPTLWRGRPRPPLQFGHLEDRDRAP